MISEKLNNKSGIYTITNLINGKIYLGFCQNFRSRYSDHKITLKNNKHGNSYLQSAYNKYGKDNFKFEILEYCDKEFLANQENYWCNMLNLHNKNFGYNIQPTHPDNLKSHSEETKLKIRTNTKGIKKSEETKKRMSEGMKGKKKSLEHRKNLSLSRTGIKINKKTLEVLKLSNTGRKHSEEEKIKRAEKIKKPIIQMDLDGNFIKEWNSATDAKKALHIKGAHIYDCCKNKRIKCDNFKWRYKL